ncbi:hypothetical protein ABEB36_004083 [Hypothenemus hampei]|uniref:Uncharacterized protein n=1 Tax=Hypothenemus hampei TaxID=57062 RepID=A0ABD1F4S7_HYPHA
MESEDRNSTADNEKWGYVIVLATVVLVVSGLSFDTSLLGLGYDSSVLACFLLMRFSYRKVSFLGSIIFLVGAISRIYVQNFIQFIISVAIFENMGIHLLALASLTALNSNFDKKVVLVACLHETAVCAFSLVLPKFTAWNEEKFGPRGPLIGLALLSCLCLPASAMLKPPPKQMIVLHCQDTEDGIIRDERIEPEKKNENSFMEVISLAEPKESITPPLADQTASKTLFNELSQKLILLKSYKYWNIIIGISLILIADYFFFSIFPAFYEKYNLTEEIGFTIMYYSAPELIFRILLTIVLAFVKLKSRLLILFTSAFVVFIRFVSTCITRVFFEEYKDNFTTAYSIFSVILNVFDLIFLGLIHLSFYWHDGQKEMENICIAAYIICLIMWTLEFTFFTKKPANTGQNLNKNQ